MVYPTSEAANHSRMVTIKRNFFGLDQIEDSHIGSLGDFVREGLSNAINTSGRSTSSMASKLYSFVGDYAESHEDPLTLGESAMHTLVSYAASSNYPMATSYVGLFISEVIYSHNDPNVPFQLNEEATKHIQDWSREIIRTAADGTTLPVNEEILAASLDTMYFHGNKSDLPLIVQLTKLYQYSEERIRDTKYIRDRIQNAMLGIVERSVPKDINLLNTPADSAALGEADRDSLIRIISHDSIDPEKANDLDVFLTDAIQDHFNETKTYTLNEEKISHLLDWGRNLLISSTRDTETTYDEDLVTSSLNILACFGNIEDLPLIVNLISKYQYTEDGEKDTKYIRDYIRNAMIYVVDNDNKISD